MKNTISLFSLLFVTGLLFANPVNKNKAVNTAIKFIKHQNLSKRTNFDVQSIEYYKFNKTNTLYIINFTESGFAILPTDDRIRPILAYSLKNTVPKNISNEEVKWLLENYSKQVNYAIKNKLDNTESLKKWNDILNNIFPKKSIKAVAPLIQTHWTQQSGYNAACPPGVQSGCVAIAMAQTLKYWNYPATGAGWNGYIHPPFTGNGHSYDWGEIRAYFSETEYDWTNMENNQATWAAAELIHHCGVAVNMFYTSWGAAANSGDVPYALANYFKYDQSMQLIQRVNYTDDAWKNILQNELDNARPIPYSGSGSSGGHEFICDGYDDTGLFHFNLGWAGSADGYYEIETLNPGGYDFSNYNDALIGLKPAVTGEEEYLWTKKLNGYQQLYSFPKYISAVNDKVVWTIPADGHTTDTLVYYQQCAKSFDGGLTWKVFDIDETLPTCFQATMIEAFNLDTAIVTFADYSDNYTTKGSILQTIDGGETWTTKMSDNESIITNFHFYNKNEGVYIGIPIAGEFKIWTTDNFNQSLQQTNAANIPDALSNEYSQPARSYSSNNTFWFSTTKARVYKTTDKGNNWTVSQLFATTDSTDIRLAFDNEGSDGLAHVTIFQNDTVFDYKYFSTDNGGNTWTEIINPTNFLPSGIDYIPGTDKSFISVGGEFYEEENNLGVAISEDGGNTWTIQKQYYSMRWFRNVKMLSADKGFAGGYSIGYSLPHKGGFWNLGEYELPLIADFEAVNDNNNIDTLHCADSDITFKSKSIGNILTYDWNFGEDATPATATGAGDHIVQYSTTGEKTVRLILTSEFDKDSIDIKHTIAGEVPYTINEITGDALVERLSVHTYSVPSQDNTFYNWTIPFTFWEGGSMTNEIVITFGGFAMTGNIEVYSYNGCGVSNTMLLEIQSVDFLNVNRINKNNIYIYPNPTTDIINIIGIEEPAYITTYDMSGKIIEQFSLKKDLSDNIQYKQSNTVNLIKQPTGIYFIKIISKNNTITKKIVKK